MKAGVPRELVDHHPCWHRRQFDLWYRNPLTQPTTHKTRVSAAFDGSAWVSQNRPPGSKFSRRLQPRPTTPCRDSGGLGLVALQFCREGLGFLRRDTVPLLVDLDEVGGIFISHLRSRVGDGTLVERTAQHMADMAKPQAPYSTMVREFLQGFEARLVAVP